jgi:hypothetical protein
LAALPSQKLLFRKYRSKIDPLLSDAVTILGTALLLFSVAISLSGIGTAGPVIGTLVGFSLVPFFILNLFREQAEYPVFFITRLISYIGLILVPIAILFTPIHNLILKNLDLCRAIFLEQRCYDHQIFPNPGTQFTLTEIFALIIVGLYFLLAIASNKHIHKLSTREHSDE